MQKKLSALSKFERRLMKIENSLHKRPDSADSSSQTQDVGFTSSPQRNLERRSPASKGFTAERYTTETLPSNLAGNFNVAQNDNRANEVPLTLGNTRLYQNPGSRLFKRLPTISSDNGWTSERRDDRDLMNSFPAAVQIQQSCDSRDSQSNSRSKAAEIYQKAEHVHKSSVDNSFQYNCAPGNRFDYLPVQDEIVENRACSNIAEIPSNTDQHSDQRPMSRIPVMISDRTNHHHLYRPNSQSRIRSVQNLKQHDFADMGTDCMDTANENDDDFMTHVRRRTKRYYVGGFLPSISERKIMNYAARRGVKLTWVNIRRYERQNRAVIRVNVDPENGYRLLDRRFWPKGVNCRPWYSKVQYRNRYTNCADDNDGRGTARGDVHDADMDAYSCDEYDVQYYYCVFINMCSFTRDVECYWSNVWRVLRQPFAWTPPTSNIRTF